MKPDDRMRYPNTSPTGAWPSESSFVRLSRRIACALLLILAIAIVASAFRSESRYTVVWTVETIRQVLIGSWHGEDETGAAVGGACFSYVAICSSLRGTCEVVLADDHWAPVSPSDLPLQPGTRFQFAEFETDLSVRLPYEAIIISQPNRVTTEKPNNRMHARYRSDSIP